MPASHLIDHQNLFTPLSVNQVNSSPSSLRSESEDSARDGAHGDEAGISEEILRRQIEQTNEKINAYFRQQMKNSQVSSSQA